MSNLCNDGDTQLVPFLRDLADSIESKQIHHEQLKRVGEFFMSYKLQEEFIENDKDSDPDKEHEDMDIIKFITLGWWIYQHILSNDGTDSPTVPSEPPNED